MTEGYEQLAALTERAAGLAEGGDAASALALDAELGSARSALPVSAPAAARPQLLRALMAERRLHAARGATRRPAPPTRPASTAAAEAQVLTGASESPVAPREGARIGPWRTTPTPLALLMELFDTTQIALRRALEGTNARHQALAGNLANVNTPGYARRDVDFQSSLRSALSDTDPRDAVMSAGAVHRVEAGAVQPDGNGVDLDLESARIAENGLLHQALVQAMSARSAILRSAMGVS